MRTYLASFALVAACGGGGSVEPDAETESADLVFHVIVSPGSFKVIARDAAFPACNCQTWPAVSDCEAWDTESEVGCSSECAPPSCLRMDLVWPQASVELVPSQLVSTTQAMYQEDAVLRISGCGFIDEIPVPYGPFPGTPVLTDFHGTYPGEMHTLWSPDISSHVLATCVLDGVACLGSGGDAVMPRICGGGPFETIAYSDSEPLSIQTGNGVVHIWQEGGSAETLLAESYYSNARVNLTEEWRIPAIPVYADPGTPLDPLKLMAVSFGVTDPAVESSLEVLARPDGAQLPGLRYQDGFNAGQLDWSDLAGDCSGISATANLTTPPILGDPAGTHLQVAVPPVTLACGSGDMSLSFTVDTDLGVVVRPDN